MIVWSARPVDLAQAAPAGTIVEIGSAGPVVACGEGGLVLEEIQTSGGLITNASSTDYLIPTTLDMPPVDAELIEDPEPDAPYGVKGVG